jgi:hypothetical protein
LKGQTEEQIKLIKGFARKYSIDFSVVGKEILEEITLVNAIESGKSGEFVKLKIF